MTYPDGRHAEQPPRHTGVPRQRSTGWLGEPTATAAWAPQPDERFMNPPAHPGYGPPPNADGQRPGWGEPQPLAQEQIPPRYAAWGGPTAPPNEPGAPPRPDTLDAQGIPAQLRGRVVDRLISINAGHAGHAADNIRTKDDLCEHALALFSVDPEDPQYNLSTATRLSLSDSSNGNLVEMLSGLCRVVEQKIADNGDRGRRWDPRTPLTGLVNRSEELRRPMIYLGVGISTLDTPEQPWRSMKSSIDRHTGLHLRGQGYLFLDDETTVHFVRAAQLGSQTGQHQVTANRMIHTQYPWRRNTDMLAHANQRTYLIWEQLRRLHQLLVTATKR